MSPLSSGVLYVLPDLKNTESRRQTGSLLTLCIYIAEWFGQQLLAGGRTVFNVLGQCTWWKFDARISKVVLQFSA